MSQIIQNLANLKEKYDMICQNGRAAVGFDPVLTQETWAYGRLYLVLRKSI